MKRSVHCATRAHFQASARTRQSTTATTLPAAAGARRRLLRLAAALLASLALRLARVAVAALAATALLPLAGDARARLAQLRLHAARLRRQNVVARVQAVDEAELLAVAQRHLNRRLALLVGAADFLRDVLDELAQMRRLVQLLEGIGDDRAVDLERLPSGDVRLRHAEAFGFRGSQRWRNWLGAIERIECSKRKCAQLEICETRAPVRANGDVFGKQITFFRCR